MSSVMRRRVLCERARRAPSTVLLLLAACGGGGSQSAADSTAAGAAAPTPAGAALGDSAVTMQDTLGMTGGNRANAPAKAPNARETAAESITVANASRAAAGSATQKAGTSP